MTSQQLFDWFWGELADGHGEREARSMARIVFKDALGIAHFFDEKPVGNASEKKAADILNRIKTGEPVQYVLGAADFFGMKFKADRRALIPRQETEELVELALHFFKKNGIRNGKILDVGTGTGCIPIVLKKKLPTLDVWAIDVSGDALDLAEENSMALFAPVNFRKLDFLNEKNWPQLIDFQLVISNPPYIPEQEKPLVGTATLAFEPALALFVDDADPLVFYKKLASFARQKLVGGGAIFVECNEFNAAEVADLFQNSGLDNVELRQDLMGKNRMVSACQPSTRS